MTPAIVASWIGVGLLGLTGLALVGGLIGCFVMLFKS